MQFCFAVLEVVAVGIVYAMFLDIHYSKDLIFWGFLVLKASK